MQNPSGETYWIYRPDWVGSSVRQSGTLAALWMPTAPYQLVSGTHSKSEVGYPYPTEMLGLMTLTLLIQTTMEDMTMYLNNIYGLLEILNLKQAGVANYVKH